MVLNSDKIYLRPLILEDLDLIHGWRNDKNLRLLALTHPYLVTMEQDRNWLNKILNNTDNTNIIFAAVLNEAKEFFGYFQLREINQLHNHAFLGIVIGNKNLRGLGLGKEVMNLGLDYGFNMLGLQKISLDVLESNVNAIRLYSNLDFLQEGKFIHHFYYNGAWHNVIRMAKFAK